MRHGMMKKLLEQLQQREMPKNLAIGLGLAGMALILISELLPAAKPDTTPAEKSTSNDTPAYSYEQQLEQRLEQLISQLNGAGTTSVMVTLISTEETVYALDVQQKGEGDSAETHVLLEDGSALFETTLMPAIGGVAVICEGGGDIAVVARVTEMLSALLDLPTNRISVQKMK